MFTDISQTAVQICVVTPALSRSVAEIDVNELYVAFLRNEPLQIVDLRHQADFVHSHIPRAFSVPAVQGRACDLSHVCRAGVRTILYSYAGSYPAVKMIADDLSRFGFSAEVLTDGWEAWSSGNFPVDSVHEDHSVAVGSNYPGVILFNPDWVG